MNILECRALIPTDVRVFVLGDLTVYGSIKDNHAHRVLDAFGIANTNKTCINVKATIDRHNARQARLAGVQRMPL